MKRVTEEIWSLHGLIRTVQSEHWSGYLDSSTTRLVGILINLLPIKMNLCPKNKISEKILKTDDLFLFLLRAQSYVIQGHH